MAEFKVPRGYEEDFDTEWYLTKIYSRVEGSEAEKTIKFFLDFFHDTFSSGAIRGEKLLDVGTGPSVHSVISASPHVTEIHLSDFANKHRKLLQQWRDGAENVPAYFEYFIKKENKGESIESRNKMMREKVKKIYPLDLQQDKPFADFDCKYDVITSCTCLDAAARNKEEHKVILSKIAGMLNPGGYLVLLGVLGEEFYVVADFKFTCLNISSAEVKDNLKEAGFTIKNWKVFENQEVLQKESEGFSSTLDGIFAVLAQKK